ncbi:MAG TPA: CHAT domain-containing protein, partial [Anaerolineales bacterium]|nr:CHAT domain-containing protein [Anaerolineales bacterium]
MISILFLSANPSDASRLRLDEEAREIQEKLQLSKERDNFEFHQRSSVRPADISQALLDINPQIVHFSGHGTETGALCFEDRSGNSHPIQPSALSALFQQFANQLSCVVLNACFSNDQAKAIAKHIEYVIGMKQSIGDRAAIAFAIGFYQALGAGRSIEEAYNLGCIQIRLQNISEHSTPVLIKTSGNQKYDKPKEYKLKDNQDHVLRILYLEDEPMLTKTLGTLIQDLYPQLQVIGTTSIEDALNRVSQEDFDGVLLDIMMPPSKDMFVEELDYGRLTG